MVSMVRGTTLTLAVKGKTNQRERHGDVDEILCVPFSCHRTVRGLQDLVLAAALSLTNLKGELSQFIGPQNLPQSAMQMTMVDQQLSLFFSAMTRHPANVGSVLGQRRRRWANTDPKFNECLLFVCWEFAPCCPFCGFNVI